MKEEENIKSKQKFQIDRFSSRPGGFFASEMHRFFFGILFLLHSNDSKSFMPHPTSLFPFFLVFFFCKQKYLDFFLLHFFVILYIFLFHFFLKYNTQILYSKFLFLCYCFFIYQFFTYSLLPLPYSVHPHGTVLEEGGKQVSGGFVILYQKEEENKYGSD